MFFLNKLSTSNIVLTVDSCLQTSHVCKVSFINISLVEWEEFKKNYNKYIDKAIDKREHKERYTLTKRLQ